jgi:hypothetical protein
MALFSPGSCSERWLSYCGATCPSLGTHGQRGLHECSKNEVFRRSRIAITNRSVRLVMHHIVTSYVCTAEDESGNDAGDQHLEDRGDVARSRRLAPHKY